jgi:lipopolysaccharide export system permease protein
MRTLSLIGSRDPKLVAELQWRLGLPVMTLVLTLLAVPLGRLRPRQGRYSHVWIAVLVFALYANLALAGRTWLSRGAIPQAFGLWWVHGLFLAGSIGAMFGPSLLRLQRARRRRA